MEDKKDEIHFEWDDRKNEINIKKHGVSFLGKLVDSTRYRIYTQNIKEKR